MDGAERDLRRMLSVDRRTTRREFMQLLAAGGAALGGAAFLAACSPPGVSGSSDSKEMIFSGYGGDWENVIRATTLEPFQKETSAKVTLDTQGASNDKLAKMRASGDQYVYDLAVLGGPETAAASSEGLIDKISDSDIPEMKNIYDLAKNGTHGYGPIVTMDSLVLVYNKEKVNPAPDSWKALTDPKYKGKVAISHANEGKGLYLLIIGAMMGGGNEKNIEPGFELIRQIAPNVGFWLTSSAQYNPYFQSGDVWLAPYWNGRAQLLIDQGMPIGTVVPKEGTLGISNVWAVPTHAKNKKLAKQLVDFYLKVPQQKAWTEKIYYTPVNKGYQMPPEIAKRVATVDQLKLPDEVTAAQERPKWIDRWNKEVQDAQKYAK